MQPIDMSAKDWYPQAMISVVQKREVVIHVSGVSAAILRTHLAAIGEKSTKAGWRNIFNMLRFRKFHRTFYSALAIGLGVEIENDDGRLVIRMNDGVGHQPPQNGVLVIQTARAAKRSAS